VSEPVVDVESLTFEEALRELQSVVAELEQSSPSLDAALAGFERGIALLRVLHGRLDEVEKRVEILERDASGVLRVRPAGGK
jgi:exodeoxyribonuclease VII small subunit